MEVSPTNQMVLMSKLTKSEKKVAKGSIYDVAASRNERPEDVLTEADVIVMLDESSSMKQEIGQNMSRHDMAVEALRSLQRTFPGRVVLISFNSAAKFHWNGLPGGPQGSTQMNLPLSMASQFVEMDMKFYLISDGRPTGGSELSSLEIVREHFQGEDFTCIFIGTDDDLEGQEFLDRLAKACGGRSQGKIRPEDLGEEVTLLLTGRK